MVAIIKQKQPLMPISIFLPEWFSGPFGLVFVLVFDVAWIKVMRLFPFKDIRTRKIMIWIVLTVSAPFITTWLFAHLMPHFSF